MILKETYQLGHLCNTKGHTSERKRFSQKYSNSYCLLIITQNLEKFISQQNASNIQNNLLQTLQLVCLRRVKSDPGVFNLLLKTVTH